MPADKKPDSRASRLLHQDGRLVINITLTSSVAVLLKREMERRGLTRHAPLINEALLHYFTNGGKSPLVEGEQAPLVVRVPSLLSSPEEVRAVGRVIDRTQAGRTVTMSAKEIKILESLLGRIDEIRDGGS